MTPLPNTHTHTLLPSLRLTAKRLMYNKSTKGPLSASNIQSLLLSHRFVFHSFHPFLQYQVKEQRKVSLFTLLASQKPESSTRRDPCEFKPRLIRRFLPFRHFFLTLDSFFGSRGEGEGNKVTSARRSAERQCGKKRPWQGDGVSGEPAAPGVPPAFKRYAHS